MPTGKYTHCYHDVVLIKYSWAILYGLLGQPLRYTFKDSDVDIPAIYFFRTIIIDFSEISLQLWMPSGLALSQSITPSLAVEIKMWEVKSK